MKMKKSYLYILCMVSAILFTRCSGDYDSFVEADDAITGAPSAVANVASAQLPGQIKLTWDIPADSNLYYVKIKYFDHLTQTEKAEVASAHTNELIIPNTRSKFGDYEFTIQSFNSKHEGGSIQTVKARSGVATATESFTYSKVVLENGQFSTDNQEPSEGPIKNLNDGDPNTFFHTRWASPQKDMPQYIQIDLKESITNFSFYYQNRKDSQVGPEKMEILVSNDGQEWVKVSDLSSGLPSGAKAEYTSSVIRSKTPFTYVRFLITKTFGDKKYFNLAELVLYNVKIDVFDPEA